ncbi:hypothetical protein [Enterovibrio norvegicus]|uniref:hypothetical protein n=1 Tax=Enterovibrio norvegicus TaxID=188144 RepID=UPI000C83DB6D|nr:hypothetical protein [Enterovibrio norvegicus]PML77189.1 hypothetical protein BCT69_21015 [Enterovibrio norvegicus]
MDIERKIEFLRDELQSLKKEGTKISEDTRKALIHDISERSRESRFKSLGLAVTFMTVIVSLIAYIGFESVKESAAESIVNSELKVFVLNELSKERKTSNLALNDAKNVIKELQVKEHALTERINKLIGKIEKKEKSLVRVTNVIAKLGINNKDIASIIDPSLLYTLNNYNIFNFTKSFGLSEISVIKLLASETEDFNFHEITKQSINASIQQIQLRYDLVIDGQLGPCTSLVIGGLLLERFEMETRNELEGSKYKSDSWLADSFQACSQNDKNQIQRYLDFPDLPLHSELNSFILAAEINRSELMKSLTNTLPNSSSYKALSEIGYELTY